MLAILLSSSEHQTVGSYIEKTWQIYKSVNILFSAACFFSLGAHIFSIFTESLANANQEGL